MDFCIIEDKGVVYPRGTRSVGIDMREMAN